MNFHAFIRYNDYSIKHQKLIQNALAAFFKSARLRPYTEAIARSQNAEERTRSMNMIQGFVGELVTFLKSDECKAMEANTKLLDLFTAQHTSINLTYDLQFEGLLRKTLFWRFSSIIDEIQQHFITLGSEFIAIEHRMAMETIARDQLISFDEYLTLAWQNASNETGAINPTVQQWYGYLRYIEELTAPFKLSCIDTENKHQALLLQEKINAACHKIEKSSEKLHALRDKNQEIEEQIQDTFTEKFNIKLSHYSKTNKLPTEDSECPKEIIDTLKQLTLKYVALNQARYLAREEIAELSTLFSDCNGIDRESALVKDFDANLEYWRTNLPLIQNRSDDIQAIANFNSDSKEDDFIYRYVSTAEFHNISKTKQFNQARGQSNEREKWFFHKGGNPGNGVTHEIICKIFLRKGTLKHLLTLQKPDGQHAAVVSKANENFCIGIHEDALHALNQLIDKVEFRDKNSKKLLSTTDFNHKINMDIPAKTNDVTRPSFLLFTSLPLPQAEQINFHSASI